MIIEEARVSATCTVCGKPRLGSGRPPLLSRLGYWVAFGAVLSPLALVGTLVPISIRARRARPLRMCEMCQWTFGAFMLGVLVIAGGIAYLVMTVK